MSKRKAPDLWESASATPRYEALLYKNAKSWLSVSMAFLALTGFADVASNVYTVVVTGGTFSAPVRIEDQQVEIYDAEAGTTTTVDFPDVAFKPNSIFRKRGTGYMFSSLGMSSFTGEIRIEEGAFVINTNNQMGVTTSAANAPLIVVSNNASFVMATRSDTCADKALKLYNPFLIAGSGCDGYGAICCDNDTSQTDWLFYGNWTLTDDATVSSTRTTRFDYGGASASIDLAGHQLTIHKIANDLGVGTFALSRCIITNSVSDVSRIVVDGLNLQLQSATRFYGDARSEIVFTNNAGVRTYSFNASYSDWTMRFAGRSSISTGNGSDQIPGQVSGFQWGGPVIVDGTKSAMTISGDSTVANAGMTITNTVSGTGSIVAKNAVLQLANLTNSFGGAVSASVAADRTGSLVLWHPWSMPPTCAGLFATNAPVQLLAQYERYDMPPTTVNVKSGNRVSFTGGSGGFAPSFRKTGPGQLDLANPLTVTGRAEVAEGTLKFSRYARAGLVAGRFQMPNRGNFSLPDGTSWTQISDAARVTTVNFTNRVACMPEFWVTNNSTFGYIPADAESTGSGAGVIVTLDGYLWNRSGETQRWTFAGGAGTHLHVWLDSESVISYVQYQTGQKKTLEVKPGAHKFRATSYVTKPGSYLSASGASFTNMTWTWTSGGVKYGAGFRYDPQGRDSTDYRDYLVFNDPGDGSLLTVSTNGTKTTVQDEPSFWALRMGADATLDTFGNGVEVGALEGFGTVTNSNAYFSHPMTVTNSWVVSAADISSGGILRMHVPLSFASGAAFVAEDLAQFPRREEPLTLCTADEPIGGLPTFDRHSDVTARKWKLLKSADGRTIQFQYCAGLIVSFR